MAEYEKLQNVVQRLQEVIAEATYPDRPRKFMMPLELAEDALAILKERESVEPYRTNGHTGTPIWRCGNCDTWIGSEVVSYCWHCGRLVKWK